MKDIIVQKAKSSLNYIKTFVKWCLIAIVVGAAGGFVGTAFHKSVDYVTEVRHVNGWLVFLLPIGGVVIVALYKLCKTNAGTNHICDFCNKCVYSRS